jgi:hypothetical protein
MWTGFLWLRIGTIWESIEVSWIYQLNLYVFLYIPYVECDPLCGLVQSSWLQIQKSWDSFSLVSATEKLLGRNISGFGLESWEYGHGNPLRWPRNTLYPRKLALSSPTGGGRSVGIVHSRTKAMESICFMQSDSRNNHQTVLETFLCKFQCNF